MHRRTFFKFLSGVATAIVTSRVWPKSLSAGTEAIVNFDYAQFCALPESDRVFSIVSKDRIVTEKLDPATWAPNTYDAPGKLPGIPDSWDGVSMQSPIPGLNGTGPYAATWDSLLQYEAPEWYQDAKFGIWAHWSPQCVPEKGDWYARNMYVEGSDQYKYHLEHYGHPSRFGYKDLSPQWTLLNWRPDELLDRYKKAGARFFFALANHHDGFDCWDSKHHPWNSQTIGPHRDVVGTWAKLAKERGLRFGVTVHQARNWWWFEPSHGADKQGPLAGVPYDGELTHRQDQQEWWQGFDPQVLYGPKHPADALPDPSYVKDFYDRTRDLIDQHDPDILYFDNSMFPLGWAGMNIAAYFYNRSLLNRGGKMDVVANIKNVPAHLVKAVVADFERGLIDEISPHVWQSETCIGNWHYDRSLYDQPGEFGGYLHPRDAIHWLIDTVSKNGVLVLNIPGKPDGTIDSKEIAVLDKITEWMSVNSEAIYETRPWKIFGEGPTKVEAGAFKGTSVANLGARDVRFTRTKDNRVVYAILLGLPRQETTIQALGLSSANSPGRIEKVEVLGGRQAPEWKQTQNGLTIKLPESLSGIPEYGVTVKAYLA
jgi:alpha-L-fucosidase